MAEAGHIAVIKPTAAATRRARRVHPRRLHRRRRPTTPSPARPGSPGRSAATGDVAFGIACTTCPLRRPMHQTQDRPHPTSAPSPHPLRQARHDWATDPTLRERYDQHRPQVERVHRPPRHPQRQTDQTPLPRHHQKPRLATPPHRRAQPAPTDQPRPHPPHRHLDPGRPTAPPGAQTAACARYRHHADQTTAGRTTTLSTPQGSDLPPHRRPCRRSSRLQTTLVQHTPRARRGAGPEARDTRAVRRTHRLPPAVSDRVAARPGRRRVRDLRPADR